MKNKIIAILLALSLILTACGEPEPDPITPAAPNARQPSIMVDDVYYFISGINANVEIDESDYLGKITSTVPLSEIPVENGHSNFVAVGTPYAEYENGIIALIEGKWVIFEVWDDETESG
jgi:hypothetical protein